ncbi:MAG TPA: helix-turn-helix domain-containing protein [Candidatus Wallbacteria bacterium]|nr:helix-turn-helix domain-containing protein [Candidatus Wallbacteria bacterium]
MNKKNEKETREKLFTVEETAERLQMNSEVLRRKLRAGLIFGIKLTPKMWKIPETSIIDYINHADNLSKHAAVAETKTSENCSRFPRWIEYSGLPGYLSQKYGIATWHVMKKIIELDCLENETAGVFFDFKIDELHEITGLTRQTLHKVLLILKREKYIDFFTIKGKKSITKFKILTPLLTPKSINEIPAEHGGVKGRLKSEVIGTCITRFF